MKIGLLTYHWVPNFGAQLQTLSTYKYLEKQGCSPIIINWIPGDAKEHYRSVNPKQRQMHDEFIERHCVVTEEFSASEDVGRVIAGNGITHVIVGSDSLFNIYKPLRSHKTLKKEYPTSDHKYPNPFWGCGFENIPHAGLSISSQNARYKDFRDDVSEIGSTLKHFCTITVRDEWTKSLVSYFTKGVVLPNVTPDPVFAFNNNVSQQIAKQDIVAKFNLADKYVLFSFSRGRMGTPQKWMEGLVKKFHGDGYQCVELGKSGGQNLNIDGKISFPLDPLDWYNLIRFSSAYIGVLMHPIVVSLHNAVPFYSFDHYGTGPLLFAKKSSSKIYDIVKRAGLTEYHFFEKNHLIYPPFERIYELVKNFPVDKCAEFSATQQRHCLDNMEHIVSELTNGKNN